MTTAFDPSDRLVVVLAQAVGPSGRLRLRLALDTGATRTVISEPFVRALGIDTARLPRPFRVAAATGSTPAGEVRLTHLSALGIDWLRPAVITYPLNAATSVDGLLGLDFLRGRVLTLDFARGRISLRPPRPWWAFWR